MIDELDIGLLLKDLPEQRLDELIEMPDLFEFAPAVLVESPSRVRMCSSLRSSTD